MLVKNILFLKTAHKKFAGYGLASWGLLYYTLFYNYDDDNDDDDGERIKTLRGELQKKKKEENR